MKRRTFLKTTLLGGGSLLFGVRCSTDDGAAGEADIASAFSPEIKPSYFPQSVASGDPTAATVILWTRVVDPAAKGDSELILEVAKDVDFKHLIKLEGGANLKVTAAAKFDHCVKVRLDSLTPHTDYFYRFLLAADGKHLSTKVGRTRTAPAADADVPVRFAVTSCQDFNGRYYNTYKQLSSENIDFFLHLGDYIYETTGDKTFQITSKDRAVKFGDEAGAIAFNKGTDDEFFAAKSLDNYRDLYRIYRSDKNLQAVHETVPMIAIPDDHEFSDDCWGANATYFDGKQDEHDTKRRADADKAWFEYMPVDYLGEPKFSFDPATAFPDSMRVYRDFAFGKHAHIVMTDLRRYRADHLIAEDAFPGALALTQTELEAVVGKLPASAGAYFDVDKHDGGSFGTVLKGAAKAAGYSQDSIKGNLSAEWVNGVIAKLNEGKADKDKIATVAEADIAKMERGFAWHHTMKAAPFSAIGSRYLVKKEVFDALATHKWKASGGKSELVLGDKQREWFLDTLQASKSTWKVWGNEYCVFPKIADLSAFDTLPTAMRTEFLLSAEDWDGFGNRRDELLTELAKVGNVVAVTGDIHAFFAATPWASKDPKSKIVEFVSSSISSATYKTMLSKQANSDPTLVAVGAGSLALVAEDILLSTLPGLTGPKANPWLAYAAMDSNGYVIVEAGATELLATYMQIPGEHASTELGADLASKFTTQRFKVVSGSPELHKEVGGAWKRWDSAKTEWV